MAHGSKRAGTSLTATIGLLPDAKTAKSRSSEVNLEKLGGCKATGKYKERVPTARRQTAEVIKLRGQGVKTDLSDLEASGIKVATGTIVDATIINAPSSTKNADQARDPDMHQTKKGNQWYFGMKAHIGVDSRVQDHPRRRRDRGERRRQPGAGRSAAWRGDAGVGRPGLSRSDVR